MKHLIPGSTAYNGSITLLEASVGRKLSQKEVDFLRKQCNASFKPSKGEGKTRARYAKPFQGQGGRATPKYARISQLPLDWQCR